MHAGEVQRRTAQHRHRIPGDRRFAQHLADHIRRQRLLGQGQLHQLIAKLIKLLEHLPAPQLGVVGDLGGKFVFNDLLALFLEGEILHLDQVDHPAEGVVQVRRTGAAGNLHGNGIVPQAVADLFKRRVEVGAFAVQLVDKGNPRHLVLVGLPPDGFALGLDAFAGAEDHHAAVEHAQAALHFGGEVDVPRRVDEVDRHLAPQKTHASGINGDAALALFLVEVGLGRAFVHVAHAMGHAGVVQHPLGQSGFAGVDMGNDADVSEGVNIARHINGRRWGRIKVLG